MTGDPRTRNKSKIGSTRKKKINIIFPVRKKNLLNTSFVEKKCRMFRVKMQKKISSDEFICL